VGNTRAAKSLESSPWCRERERENEDEAKACPVDDNDK
jgi:hypothetical protein